MLCVALQVASNKRYAGAGQFTVSEVAERVKADIGNIDIVVSHRLMHWETEGSLSVSSICECSSWVPCESLQHSHGWWQMQACKRSPVMRTPLHKLMLFPAGGHVQTLRVCATGLAQQ